MTSTMATSSGFIKAQPVLRLSIMPMPYAPRVIITPKNTELVNISFILAVL